MAEPSMLPQLGNVRRSEAERRRHLGNKGRLAMTGEFYETTGMGVFEFNKKVDFGLTFIRKPLMSYGSEVDPDEVRELCDIDDDEDLPNIQCSGFVTDWDRTEKGMYVGAWVAASVLYPLDDGSSTSTATLVPVDAELVVKHHFSWWEVALKSIGVGDGIAPAGLSTDL